MNSPEKIGPYRLVRVLGAGGMGTVYEAQRDDGPHVALKAFSVDSAKARFLRERFETEGRILEKLRHPRLVSVYESGADKESGRPYYVMALVSDAAGNATTLHDVSARGKVTEDRAERWYRDLCDVLAFCHSRGVVHRDVKLSNVLLDAEDHAVLSDFGVSRIVDDDLREELKVETTFVTGGTTGTRPVMGSYWYLAPEVRRGEPATFAGDWYALGVLFFRLLTGMWYEPGTDALALLAPYDRRWKTRLERLLSDDPVRRLPTDQPVPARRRAGNRLSRRVLVVVLAFGAVIAACLAVWHVGRDDSVPLPVTPEEPRIELTFDASNRFAFCRCQAGTNGYDKATVTLTHPYWLAATPVTRRQWFAVRGEPLSAWTGGEDAPMTYVSRDEVQDFCARLNARFSSKMPRGYEIRLPTLAEWRLAYALGNTVPTHFADGDAKRRAFLERGWYGQGFNGESKFSDMRRHYAETTHLVPLVSNIWSSFPPRVINPGQDEWERYSSVIPPVPVGLKPANEIGLHDMMGNCFERVLDTCSDKVHHWGKTEWGATTIGLYAGQGLALTNPVERTGSLPLMVGTYLAPDIEGDHAWSSVFERLPHLGFRLCLGPKIERQDVP